MRKIDNLKEILEKHKLWLEGKLGGERANLENANLRNADLRNADLRNANLRDANLRDADLENAILWNVNLRNANLCNVDLRNANLENARLPHFQVCPEEGSFIAYKKVRDSVVLKLRVPAKAKRTSNLKNRKCRASEVKVLGWYDKGTLLKISRTFLGMWDGNTQYTVGETTKPDSFCDDIRQDCAPGIHFFITKKEAEEWV